MVGVRHLAMPHIMEALEIMTEMQLDMLREKCPNTELFLVSTSVYKLLHK